MSEPRRFRPKPARCPSCDSLDVRFRNMMKGAGGVPAHACKNIWHDVDEPEPQTMTEKVDVILARAAETGTLVYATVTETPGLRDEDLRGDVDPLERQVGGGHYRQTRIQPIQVILDWRLDFCLGNVLKYIQRLGRKGTDPVEDIDKAIHYLQIARADIIARLPAVKESPGAQA